jgi:methylmalonyl-CoA epimerase
MRASRVDHTAIVVDDLDDAILRWNNIAGTTLVKRQVVEHQRVEVAMLQLGDTQIELISPLDYDSGVARFLANRGESLHHVALQVPDIRGSIADLTAAGVAFIDLEPRPGIDGEVAFLRPSATGSILVELVETSPGKEM